MKNLTNNLTIQDLFELNYSNKQNDEEYSSNDNKSSDSFIANKVTFNEDDILSWFSQKGIKQGNPEEVIEKQREKQRKNINKLLTSQDVKKSSIIQRRKGMGLKLSL